ncbi:MAG: UPF0149 family protein [Holosporaceae bacterium]|jgi:uncharacterized protein|nr:UPF0149 family protein [Holosporaceae bacterium]
MPTHPDDKKLEPFCDEEMKKLSDILGSFPSEEAMTLEMLDGFFAALHCCHKLMPSSSYLHMIYGEEQGSEPPFEDEEQFCDFFELLMRYRNSIGDRLRNGRFVPLVEDIPEIGMIWSIGFLHGILLGNENFESMMRDEDESMAFMPFFMLAFGGNELPKDMPPLFDEEITLKMREELVDTLPFCVIFIYSRFSNSDGISQPIGEGKIDQNDPCPCGSGKKYKKCCSDKIIH